MVTNMSVSCFGKSLNHKTTQSHFLSFHLSHSTEIINASSDEIAKTGRKNVCCLYRENTELPYDMPSDMHGIVYISFKESVAEIKDKIAKELKDAGFEVKA